jgi:hypothetical protein
MKLPEFDVAMTQGDDRALTLGQIHTPQASRMVDQ